MPRMRAQFKAKRLLRAFQVVARRTMHANTMWNEIGELVVSSVQRNFHQSGRPTKWKRVQRRRKRGGNKPLVDTGRLANSITYESSPHGVDVGTNVVYAATHNFGRGPIPQREFLLLQRSDERGILKIVDEYAFGPLV